ncbi:MAG: hypothetical protein LUB59_01090 [Candidatus Gastranaerophilales bacterium]|nr:hypothetical protein [Candidatus Gastranaerophilales bacterium]
MTWIIVLIIALVAAIYAVCSAIAQMTGVANSGFGVITGGISVVIAFFQNLGLSVANITLGIWSAIGALCTNMMAAFSNAISSIQSWFYDLLSTAMSVIAGIASALNSLPFVEFDYSGITAAADDYAAKSAAAASNKQEYTSVSDAFSSGAGTFDTFQSGWASKAFSSGVSWGDGVVDSISSALDPTNLFSTSDIPTATDYAYSGGNYDLGEIPEGVDDIAGNTGSIADSMDITQDELKYMRDIAEQEAINRYTNIDLTVDQSGMQNYVSNGMDLDGVITKLTDQIREAQEIAAEGIHD